MNITILCTDRGHPVVEHLRRWSEETTAAGHSVQLVYDKSQLTGGDLLFLVSCGQYIGLEDRRNYAATLVLHASDLPTGRGWSPHIWAIVGGAAQITVCLLEASDPIDSGDVWLRERFTLEGHELLPEINEKLFRVELALMSRAVREGAAIVGTSQVGDPGPVLRKRTPADSRLDPQRTIADQFDLLRVVDNERYPAFFVYRGHRYVLKVEKAGREEAS